MGASIAKQFRSLVSEDGKDEDYDQLFSALDQDKDNFVSLDEWMANAHGVWAGVRGAAERIVREEVATTYTSVCSAQERNFDVVSGRAVGRAAAAAVAVIAAQLWVMGAEAESEQPFARRMFAVADARKEGKLSHQDLKNWLSTTARTLQRESADQLRNAVADHVESNNGVLKVNSEGVTICVDIKGVHAEAIRRPPSKKDE